MNITNSIKKENENFKKYHKNKVNIFFHLLLGTIYTFLIFDTNISKISDFLLLTYLVIIGITMKNFKNTYYLTLVFVLIKLIYEINPNNILSKINYKYKVIISLVSYLSIELSHIITNEKSFIDSKSSTISYLINYFYLLPFTTSIYVQ